MKKNLLNLGKVLTKTEQKLIFGGLDDFKREGDGCDGLEGLYEPGCPCTSDNQCGGFTACISGSCL